MTERVVALVDMDCFYVQVEEREQPHLRGTPAAVVQYNTWRGGGIIAVNYEARALGVKRGMRGDQAREKCPNIQLFQVPVSRGKADLTKYREAGKEVINVLVEFSDCIERASIDEAYIDLTDVVEQQLAEATGANRVVTASALPSTWVTGHGGNSGEDGQGERETGLTKWLSALYQKEEEEEDGEVKSLGSVNRDNLRLAVAAVHCEEMRRAVFERTGFKCSAGIAHNKVLAKLSCGLHKPNQQTVLPQEEVPGLWDSMPVGKVRNLGGKLGESLTERLSCVTMGDLASVSLSRLMAHYDPKTAQWLHNLGRGMDSEPVTDRQLPKSLGCGKNFQGREALDTPEKVRNWTRSLAEELSERLTDDRAANKRCANTLTVGVRLDGDERWVSINRSCRLPSYDSERITCLALALFQHTNTASAQDSVWLPAIKHIHLSASKFEDVAGLGSANIKEMFRRAERKADSSPKVASTAPASTSLFSTSTLLSPKMPSTTLFSTKVLQSPLTTTSTFPSPSTTTASSSSSSVCKRNFDDDQEDVKTDHLETLQEPSSQSQLFGGAASRSEPLEMTVNQSQATMNPSNRSQTSGTTINQSEVTNISARSRVEVDQGRTSFPSQVSEDRGSGKSPSGPTNSFFKNFLLQKMKTEKGDLCGSSGPYSAQGDVSSPGSTVNIDGFTKVSCDGRVSAKAREEEEEEEEAPGECDGNNERSEWSGREVGIMSEDSPLNSHSGPGGRRGTSGETEVLDGDENSEGDGRVGNGDPGTDSEEEGREGGLDAKNCDGNEGKDDSSNDLDIMISILDEHDEGMRREAEGGGGGRDGREAVQDQPVGITSCSLSSSKEFGSSQSPELFSSWEVEKVAEVVREGSLRRKKRVRPAMERDGTPKRSNRESPGSASIALKDQRTSGDSVLTSKGIVGTRDNLGKNTVEGAHGGASTTGQGQGGSSKVSASQCKTLARELFPDLDNVDASLLPLLPLELRQEVEQQLARHSLRDASLGSRTFKDSGAERQPSIQTGLKGQPASHTHTPQDRVGIMRYMQHSPKKPSAPPPQARPPAVLEGDEVECRECRQWVSAFELPEHLDYHVALKLQRELRQECSSSGTAQATASPTKRGRKRGRPGARHPAVDSKKIQKLDSFFTR